MSIPAEVSLEAVQQDLVEVAPFMIAAGLSFDVGDLSAENLKLKVTFRNRAGGRFFAEFDCCEYPLFPPTIEFTDEARQARGQPRFYPNVFHTAPCVCARYNRKAYGELGGPHNDWRLIDWCQRSCIMFCRT